MIDADPFIVLKRICRYCPAYWIFHAAHTWGVLGDETVILAAAGCCLDGTGKWELRLEFQRVVTMPAFCRAHYRRLYHRSDFSMLPGRPLDEK
jgi:hypothetical protein